MTREVLGLVVCERGLPPARHLTMWLMRVTARIGNA